MYAAHMFVQDSEYMCVRLEFEVRMFDVLHYSSVLLYFDFFNILKLCCITSLLPTLPRTSPHSFFITFVKFIYVQTYTCKFLHTYIQPAHYDETSSLHKDLLYFFKTWLLNQTTHQSRQSLQSAYSRDSVSLFKGCLTYTLHQCSAEPADSLVLKGDASLRLLMSEVGGNSQMHAAIQPCFFASQPGTGHTHFHGDHLNLAMLFSLILRSS